MASVYSDSIKVDENVNAHTIIGIGNKNLRWLGAVGEYLSDRLGEWNPTLDINLAGIWELTKDFDLFTKKFIRSWLEEYLHVEVRMECTPKPFGRGCLPSEWKGGNEELYMRNLINVLYDEKKIDDFIIYVSSSQIISSATG